MKKGSNDIIKGKVGFKAMRTMQPHRTATFGEEVELY